MTGGRLKRVARARLGDETFCFTYGDCVADLDIDELLEFHRAEDALATLTAIRPPGRFGALALGDDATKIEHSTRSRTATAAGSTAASSCSSPTCSTTSTATRPIWEREPLERLASEGRLAAYRHDGYWQNMDSLRDKMVLEEQWAERQRRRGRPGSAAPACRSCGAPLEHVRSSTSASRRSRTRTSRRRTSAQAEPFYPLRVYVCDECFLVQLPESATPEEIFSDYAYFSSFSDSWLEHARRYVEAMIERLRPRRDEPGRRDREQRRLPAAVLRRARRPVLGIEPAANVAAAARRARDPDARRVLRQRDGAASCAPRASAADLAARQQRARARARPQRLRRGPAAILLKPDGVVDDGVPAPAAADRADRVRHDLPRALLVLLAARRRAAVRARTACGSSTSRSCRRTAARCASTLRQRDGGRASAVGAAWRAARARARGRARPARDATRASSSRCARSSATCSSS